MKHLVLPDDHELCIRTFLNEISSLTGNAHPGAVLHVGAHMGEEVPAYRDMGYNPIHLVEANPEIVPQLLAKFEGQDVNVLPLALGDNIGEVEFIVHRTSKGGMESAGILPLAWLGQIVPVFDSEVTHMVKMVTLDSLESKIGACDLLTVDVQGAELLVLKSGKQFLKNVNFVICEVNLIENYKNCPLEKDIDDLMSGLGFKKKLAIYHELYDETGRFPAWGECLWQR